MTTDHTAYPVPAWLPAALECALGAALESGAMSYVDAMHALVEAVGDYATTAINESGAADLPGALGELWFHAASLYTPAVRCLTQGGKPAALLLLGPDGKPVDESTLDLWGRAQVACGRFLTAALSDDRPGMLGLALGTFSRGRDDALTSTVAVLLAVGEQVLAHGAAHDTTMPADVRAAVHRRAAASTVSGAVMDTATQTATAMGLGLGKAVRI